jgi:G patch domain-containing protein 1
VEKWVPDRIVCKRFNIADPYEDSREPKEKADSQPQQGESVEQWLRMDIQRDAVGGGRTGNIEKSEAVVEEGVIELPSMDLFRAIFADSDEEEDSDVESVDMIVEEPPRPPVIPHEPIKTDIVMEEVVPSRKSPISFKPTFRKKEDRSSIKEK